MGIINKKNKKEGKAEKALKALVETIPEIYDYDLRKLINLVEEELKKRETKRSSMINSIEDMCKCMIKENETGYTFYYNARTPEELLEYAENDEITDEGYDNICQQLGEKGTKAVQYEHKTFLIKEYLQKDGFYCFDVEMIERVENL